MGDVPDGDDIYNLTFGRSSVVSGINANHIIADPDTKEVYVADLNRLYKLKPFIHNFPKVVTYDYVVNIQDEIKALHLTHDKKIIVATSVPTRSRTNNCPGIRIFDNFFVLQSNIEIDPLQGYSIEAITTLGSDINYVYAFVINTTCTTYHNWSTYNVKTRLLEVKTNDKNETPRAIAQNDLTYAENTHSSKDRSSFQYRVCTNKRGEFISGPYSLNKDPFMEVTSWEGTYRHVWPIIIVDRKTNLVDLNTDQNNRPVFLFNSDNETGKKSPKSFARLRGHEENDILEITIESKIVPKRIVHLSDKIYLLLYKVDGNSKTRIVEMEIVDREIIEHTKNKATETDHLKKIKPTKDKATLSETKSGSYMLKFMVLFGIVCALIFPIFISTIEAIVPR